LTTKKHIFHTCLLLYYALVVDVKESSFNVHQYHFFSFLAEGDDWALAMASFLCSAEPAAHSSVALDIDGTPATASELVLKPHT
jgi:hypothetical protein